MRNTFSAPIVLGPKCGNTLVPPEQNVLIFFLNNIYKYIYIYIIYIYIYIYPQARVSSVENEQRTTGISRRLIYTYIYIYLGPKLPNTLSPKYPRGQNVLIPLSCIHPSVTRELWKFKRKICEELFPNITANYSVLSHQLYTLNG